MAFDKLELFRDGSTNLTATETGTAVDKGAAVADALNGEEFEVTVPQATGTLPTLDITGDESTDNSTWVTSVIKAPAVQITLAGSYRFRWFSTKRYRRLVFTVGGTTPNFGKVVAGPVSGGQYDNSIKQ